MKVSREADYAVGALVYLSGLPLHKRASTATISKTKGIPLPFLRKVMSQLVTAGLVDASRGKGGGVSLARSPEEITLLQVVKAVKGPILLNPCLLHRGACLREPDCAIRDMWTDIEARFLRDLDAVTMAELAGREAKKKAGAQD